MCPDLLGAGRLTERSKFCPVCLDHNKVKGKKLTLKKEKSLMFVGEGKSAEQICLTCGERQLLNGRFFCTLCLSSPSCLTLM